MSSDQPNGFEELLRKYIFILIGWSVLVGGSLAWNIRQESNETLSMAVARGRANIAKDIIFRKWVAFHGGVYVKSTDATPPNPYLKVPDRDVVTTKGMALTLMNPAYALRELQERVDKNAVVKSHITSLNPINPYNVADAWERSALQRFEKGEKEVMEVQQSGGDSHLRLMTPFTVEKDCLKCHEQQGYKLGDIRGGISTDVTLSAYQPDESKRIYTQMLSHGLIWFVGLVGGFGFFRRERRLDNARKQAEVIIKNERTQFLTILEELPGFVYLQAPDYSIRFANRYFQKQFGKPKLCYESLCGLTKPCEECPTFRVFDTNTPQVWESCTTRDGRIYQVYDYPFTDHDGTRLVLELGVDITERKEMEEEIRQLAFFDSLTNLPNRRLLNDRLTQAFSLSRRSSRYGALMFIDLDNFKPLNDRYGHNVGDLLLIEVARRLTSDIREVDTVARFGGDEFVVMLTELEADKVEATSLARILAEKILSMLSVPYELTASEGMSEKSVTHICSASIGVAMFFNHENSPEEIIKWADIAMYQAKESGRNQVRFYGTTG